MKFNPDRVDIEWHGDVLAVRLREASGIGYEAPMELQAELESLCDEESPTKVVFDFSQIFSYGSGYTFDAVFKNALLRFWKKLKAADAELRVCGMTDEVRDFYRMANLDGTLFAIDDSVEDSLAAFESTSGPRRDRRR